MFRYCVFTAVPKFPVNSNRFWLDLVSEFSTVIFSVTGVNIAGSFYIFCFKSGSSENEKESETAKLQHLVCRSYETPVLHIEV